ncbi:hypothetical protein B0H14DRAFT_2590820 [Mycena olivaceomarginata]|nr:hypothetical protein B0H14DRAFT_2590820 [Mycena olivaceomarginata]
MVGSSVRDDDTTRKAVRRLRSHARSRATIEDSDGESAEPSVAASQLQKTGFRGIRQQHWNAENVLAKQDEHRLIELMVVLAHRRREGGGWEGGGREGRKALTSVKKHPHDPKIGTDQNRVAVLRPTLTVGASINNTKFVMCWGQQGDAGRRREECQWKSGRMRAGGGGGDSPDIEDKVVNQAVNSDSGARDGKSRDDATALSSSYVQVFGEEVVEGISGGVGESIGGPYVIGGSYAYKTPLLCATPSAAVGGTMPPLRATSSAVERLLGGLSMSLHATASVLSARSLPESIGVVRMWYELGNLETTIYHSALPVLPRSRTNRITHVVGPATSSDP